MSDFDENKHPRASDGKFTNGNGGDDGNDGNGGYSDGVNERIKWAKENGIDLPLNEDGSVDDLKLQEFYEENHTKKKMTPAEKIASVHIDFTRDNILPELNEDTLEKLGEEKNRKVLLKASTIKRNLGKHIDVSEDVMRDIIVETLYNPIDVFPANPKNPNYYHMASFIEIKGKDGLKMGLLLLGVDKNKDYFDIGHAYFVDGDNFDKAQKKAQKKD